MGTSTRYIYADDPIEINAGRRVATLRVSNTGDRAVQVGSHYHFAEANPALDFDRAAATGMHLDIPSGTAVRFEPGDTREVTLCEYGGTQQIIGFRTPAQGGGAEHRSDEGARSAGADGARKGTAGGHK